MITGTITHPEILSQLARAGHGSPRFARWMDTDTRVRRERSGHRIQQLAAAATQQGIASDPETFAASVPAWGRERIDQRRAPFVGANRTKVGILRLPKNCAPPFR
jgi:hypothetical protein